MKLTRKERKKEARITRLANRTPKVESDADKAARKERAKSFDNRRASAINAAGGLPEATPTKRKAVAVGDPLPAGKTSKRSLRKGTASAIKQFNRAKNAKAQAVAQAQRMGQHKFRGNIYGTLQR